MGSAAGPIRTLGCRQFGPVTHCSYPSWSSLEGLVDQTIHKPGHRDATTSSFMVERRDQRPRNGWLVAARSCHCIDICRGTSDHCIPSGSKQADRCRSVGSERPWNLDQNSNLFRFGKWRLKTFLPRLFIDPVGEDALSVITFVHLGIGIVQRWITSDRGDVNFKLASK